MHIDLSLQVWAWQAVKEREESDDLMGELMNNLITGVLETRNF